MRTNTSGRRIRGFAAAAAVLAAGIGIAGSADAAAVFTDNFDGAPSGSALNTAPTNWAVITGSGSVDWINNSNSYGNNGTNLQCLNSSAGCVDLDGSTNNPGIMSHGTFNLQQGTTYVLSAYVSGNQRGTDYPSRGPDDLSFGFLDSTNAFITNGSKTISNIAATAGYTLVSFAFTADKDYAGASIFFEALGGDNVGPILDDVSLTAVPLPAAAWLLLSGLVGLGAVGRRRANATA